MKHGSLYDQKQAKKNQKNKKPHTKNKTRTTTITPPRTKKTNTKSSRISLQRNSPCGAASNLQAETGTAEVPQKGTS